MNTDVFLNASPRTQTGSGASRRLRREGMLPAVLYGLEHEAQNLTVNYKEFKEAFSGSGASAMFNLQIEDADGPKRKTVTLKEHQVDPISRKVIHADFLEIDVNKPLEIDIPLILNGKPFGVEQGGMLQQIRRVLTVSALPKDMPEKVEVDVSHLNMGESLHVEEVQVPDGARIVHDVNFTVATIIVPRGVKSGVEEEEEGEAEAEETA
jgi:large subunit ribosomal protein L25